MARAAARGAQGSDRCARSTGVCVGGNEYLRALVGDFNDARADEVMGRYSTFATAAMNA